MYLHSNFHLTLRRNIIAKVVGYEISKYDFNYIHNYKLQQI